MNQNKETDNDTSLSEREQMFQTGPCLKTRKKRLSTEEIIDYINWALINDNMKMIKNNSLVFVQKSYKEQTGRDVSITFIRNQKIKMFKCNNGVPH